MGRLVFEVGRRGKAAYSPWVLETPSMGFSVFFKFDWFLSSNAGSLAALRAAVLKGGCLLGNPNPLRGLWDFLRRLVSELPGSIKKSQGPKSLGLPSSHSGEKVKLILESNCWRPIET